MKQFKRIVEKVFEFGKLSQNRTDTNAISAFGHQERFRLNFENGVYKDFPLLTLKKTFERGIIEELIWFLNGDTNVKTLQDKNVHIWDAWRRPYNARKKQVSFQPNNKFCQSNTVYYSDLPLDYEDSFSDLDKNILKIWKMMASFGQNVSKDWHIFSNFQKDVKELPQFWYKENNIEDFVIFPYFSSNDYFSKETCVWVSKEEAEEYYKWDNNPNQNVDGSIVRYELIKEGDLGHVYGKQWVSWSTENQDVTINQIQNVVDILKKDPTSRRLVVSAWNPSDLEVMALPPCHCLFQFNGEPMTKKERKEIFEKNPSVYSSIEEVPTHFLDLQLYQRSADIGLGVPFNIASYTMLMIMMAQQTNMIARDFVHTFGDLHIYENHIEEMKEVIKLEEYELPSIKINKAEDVFSYDVKDFEIIDYKSHPKVKLEVAV